MRTNHRAAVALTVVALLSTASVSPAIAVPTERTSRRVAPGIRLISLWYERGPVRAFVLRIVLRDGNAVEPALAGGSFPSYASVLEIAEREDAIAAVNGDFGDGRPVHAFAIAGTLVASGASGAVVGFALDGSGGHAGQPYLRIAAGSRGIERTRVAAWNSGPPVRGEVAAFTPAGGLLERPPGNACSARLLPALRSPTTRVRSWTVVPYVVGERGCDDEPMSFDRGVVLSSRATGRGARWIRSLKEGAAIEIRWSSRWPAVGAVQGGYPMLVRHGAVVVPVECHDLFCLRQPRTGVGVERGCVDRDAETRCVVALVVVDGRRQGWSTGLTLVAFARLMRRLGAVSALNMDGGGSSQMVVRGQVINRPSDRLLRDVESAWVVGAG